MKYIFVINGSGGVGKDTFVTYVSNNLEQSSFPSRKVLNFSSVDRVKEIAAEIGWDGSKEEKDRKFLSDLKALTRDYCDMPFKSMQKKVSYFLQSPYDVLFLHIREPEEIQRAVDEFGAKSVLVVRDSIEVISSNTSDLNVFNYTYDTTIYNNGTLEDLNELAREFVGSLSFD